MTPPRTPIPPAVRIAGLALLAACARPSTRAEARRLLPDATSPDAVSARLEASSGPSAGEVWTYEVRASQGGEVLEVTAAFPAGAEGRTLELGPRMRPFVEDLATAAGETWRAVEERDGEWPIDDPARGLRIHYKVRLGDAARAIDQPAVARAYEGALVSSPSTWLVHPSYAARASSAPGVRVRLRVASAPGESFVTGLRPAADERDAYEASAGDLGLLPYAAFGRFRVRPLEGTGVVAAILPGKLAHEREVLDWIATSARAVEGYYGRLPVEPLLVLVEPVPGRGVRSGTTLGRSGAAIFVPVGGSSTRGSLADEHHWLEEGLATYVEPLARAQAGLVSPESLWSEWVRGMPQGQPGPGDGGLDGTRSWGRTYWGGALDCLLADVEIRRRTDGRRSLRDALRGIVAAGGDITVSWPIERVIAAGDAATGVPVLREIYERTARKPYTVDLDALWAALGVVPAGRGVDFDDAAPEARLRQAFLEDRTSRDSR